jgi:xanthine/CO dehydrogenase XdhC/CoxF family maturation factor
LRKAQFAMFEKKNKLEIYDTTDDENNKLGVQLGCNGIVYILFEAINNNDENNPVSILKRIAGKRKDAVLVTIFNEQKTALQVGTIGFVNGEDVFFKNDGYPSLQQDSIHTLNNKSSIIQQTGNQSALLQFIPPSLRIVVVGAGNDARPVVEMASLLGWHITVVDGRPAYVNRERFAKANEVLVSKPAEILSLIQLDEQTAVILMTHNYNYDLAVLEKIIPLPCRYIGLLGPKKKLDKMMDELKEKEIPVSAQEMKKVYGPVGLDIGAETAEEIAVSIIAEIKAVFSDRQGANLKYRVTEIHDHNLAPQHE